MDKANLVYLKGEKIDEILHRYREVDVRAALEQLRAEATTQQEKEHWRRLTLSLDRGA